MATEEMSISRAEYRMSSVHYGGGGGVVVFNEQKASFLNRKPKVR